jgi:ABC-type branched-subunit amino acid transport system ATPase component
VTAILDVRDLTKVYGDTTALDSVTLSVEQGVLFGLLGPNRSGKTTMIKLLTGQVWPSGGAATVPGRDVVADPVEGTLAGRDHTRTGDAAEFSHRRGVSPPCRRHQEDPGMI